MDDALAYLDEQIQALKLHVPAALGAFDETGVHQARVATRRLKAGLDLLSPLFEAKQAEPIARAGKRLRRRLGPLRDLDVMVNHIAGFETAPRLKPAVEWLGSQFEKQRMKARVEDQEHGQRAGKILDKFDAWWPLRHALHQHADAIEPLLTAALHDRFNAFAQQADWVAGVVETPSEHHPLDVHQVRINGKALRYTFEIAAAQGLKIPKRVFKTFKAMQESLGAWHDYVVLAERALGAMTETLLAHHTPQQAAEVLDLAKVLLKKSVVELNRFRAQWKRGGAALRASLDKHLPLVRDVITPGDVVEITELKTGLDPISTVETTPPVTPDAIETPAS